VPLKPILVLFSGLQQAPSPRQTKAKHDVILLESVKAYQEKCGK